MYKFRIIGIIGANGLARLEEALAAVEGVTDVKAHPFDNSISVYGATDIKKILEAARRQGIQIDLLSQA